MATEHDFTHSRNLYEKLERDSRRLDSELNGDNFFNFISTACHLQKWIKKEEGLQSDATVDRLLKKLHDDPKMKLCAEILDGKKVFKITIDEDPNQANVIIGDVELNPNGLKAEIMEIYQSYFLVKR
jgi:formate dehydrogenase maturation protein FdhE